MLILALMLTYSFMPCPPYVHIHIHIHASLRFVQSHLCTNINTQMGWTFAQCSPHTVTSSPPTGSQPQCHKAGTLTLTTAFPHSASHNPKILVSPWCTHSHILSMHWCGCAIMLHADENFHKGTHIPSLWVEQNFQFQKISWSKRLIS